MKIFFYTFLMMALANQVKAEVISCQGITNDPNTTIMNFDLEIQGKPNKNGLAKVDYKSYITYKTPDGSPLIQGIDLNTKIHARINKIIYAGSNANNFLEINFPSDNTAPSFILNHPLAGFKQLLLDCRISGNLPQRPVCSNEVDKNKPLLSAIKNFQSLDDIENAIQCGANVNKADTNGCTPLMFALEPLCGQTNANPYQSTFSNAVEIMDSLTANGAFVSVADKRGQTPVMKAAKFNIKDVYESFIAAEADFDAQDESGNTALMYAVRTGDSGTVQQVLDGNPNRAQKNKKGYTAFAIAQQLQKKAIADLVRVPDLLIAIKGSEDGTCAPLEISAKQGQVIELTLQGSTKMFRLEAKSLDLDLMADINSSTRKTFVAETPGTFPFACGFHGANEVSQGNITIQ